MADAGDSKSPARKGVPVQVRGPVFGRKAKNGTDLCPASFRGSECYKKFWGFGYLPESGDRRRRQTRSEYGIPSKREWDQPDFRASIAETVNSERIEMIRWTATTTIAIPDGSIAPVG